MALPAPITVAMEATLYWEWLVGQLQLIGITAHAAHVSREAHLASAGEGGSDRRAQIGSSGFSLKLSYH